MQDDPAATDELAAAHLDGALAGAALNTVALCRMRRLVVSVKPWRQGERSDLGTKGLNSNIQQIVYALVSLGERVLSVICIHMK